MYNTLTEKTLASGKLSDWRISVGSKPLNLHRHAEVFCVDAAETSGLTGVEQQESQNVLFRMQHFPLPGYVLLRQVAIRLYEGKNF